MDTIESLRAELHRLSTAAREVARIINEGENHYLGCYCHAESSHEEGWCDGCRLRLAVSTMSALAPSESTPEQLAATCKPSLHVEQPAEKGARSER